MGEDIINHIWPDWHIERTIGRGSFGTVYEAVRKDHDLESRCAVKVMSIPQDEMELETLWTDEMGGDMSRTYLKNLVDDFIREIRIMQTFKGTQNIVSVEDYKVVEKPGQVGWDIFIRMELLTPFPSWCTHREVTEEDILRVGADLCSALELCAEKHVIHRDIKPENIFVNDFGSFKLGDFGIARSMENLTQSLSYKGTYNYMAPEVVQGKAYDAAADIYSLGLVLYKLANKNRLPFLNTEKQLLSPSDRAEATRRRIAGEKLPLPCDASPQLAQVILKACAPDPRDRYYSAVEMKRALRGLAEKNIWDGGEPEPPVSYRARYAGTYTAPAKEKTAKPRKPRILILALILLVIFLAGGAAIVVPHIFSGTRTVVSLEDDGQPNQVSMDITLENNLLFSRYDVDIYLDEEYNYTLSQGSAVTLSGTISGGTHTLQFFRHDNPKVSSSKRTFTINGATRYEIVVEAQHNQVYIRTFEERP